MSDINLLPDEQRKKEDKFLKNKNDFGDEIEFTSGEKLEKENESYKNYKNSFIDDIANIFSKKKIQNENSTQISHIEKKPINNVVPEKKINKVENIDSKKTINVGSMNMSGNKDINEELIIEDVKGDKTLVEKEVLEPKKQPNIKIDAPKLKESTVLENKSSFFKSIISIFNKKSKKSNEDNDVNLLPQNTNIPSQQKITTLLVSTFLIAVVIVFMVYFAITIYKIQIDTEIVSINSQIQDVVDSSESYDKLILEIEGWKGRVSNIKELLTKHVYWTKFFSILEQNILPEVKFNSFAGSVGGNLTLSASAPDYYTLSRQWIHLNQENSFVDSVVINSASITGSQDSGTGPRINFSMTLDLKDDIFYKK